MLANILLDQLDRELQRRGHRFARYADDMIILVKSERAAQRVMQSITRYLEHTLKLKVNPAKSKLAPMRECSFLSFTIKGGKIRWTDKALAHFKLEAGLSNAWLKGKAWSALKTCGARPKAIRTKRQNAFVERANLLNRPLRTRTVGGVGAGS